MAYDAMTATSPAAYLWFVTIIVLGNYILLNLFLAILLENFGASTNGGASTANSTGGTLAAAAKAAQLTAWLQDLLQESWFAKMFKSRNRVSAMQDEGDDELVAPRFSSAGGNKQVQASQQVPAVAFQPVAGSSNNAGAAVTRGPAFLQGPASSWDPGNKLLSLTVQRPSIAGGYPMAAPNRRYAPRAAAPCTHTTCRVICATLCFAWTQTLGQKDWQPLLEHGCDLAAFA